MAVLLRALGIPARIAIGYTPGTYDAQTQTYTVSSTNAHSWVEVQFPHYGWLPFESTPGRTNPTAASYVSLPTTISNTTPNCRIAPKGIDAFQQCATRGTQRGGHVPNPQGGTARGGGGQTGLGRSQHRHAAPAHRSSRAPLVAMWLAIILVLVL